MVRSAALHEPERPLTPAVLHILLALGEGPLHGLAIRDAVEHRTGGDVQLGPGTLYEAIHRLERAGWIVRAGDDEPAAGDRGGRPRKRYGLTVEGRRRLARELTRLEALVRWARSRTLVADPEGAP